MYHLPIDPMLLIVGFSVLSVVLLIAVIVCIVKMNKLYRRYDLFMRGKDAETLEDTLEDILEVSVLSVVLLIAVIVCIVKMNKLYRRYDLFMRGKDAETLEDTLEDILEELKESQSRDRASKDAMKRLSKQVKDSFQKFGIKGKPVQGPGQQGRYETAVQAGKGFIPEIWICQI